MLDKNITLQGKTILVTGAAGFIGANLTIALLRSRKDVQIIGIDNLNDYYDVSLKEYRLRKILDMTQEVPGTFFFMKESIGEKAAVTQIFRNYCPDIVVNLAAQAGVRYSITNPDAYIESNLIGFYNILEACRHSYDGDKSGVEHLVYASSSSVYGNNQKVPYSVEDKVDYPVSLYAATKKSNELLAHAYAKLYGIPSTGLRFFTVYGPAGRPDMAYFGFTNQMRAGEKIRIFNYGKCRRDFTYIDDIVSGVMEIVQRQPLPNQEGVKYRIYNIGNSHPESLLDFVDILQEELKKAQVISKGYDLKAHIELVDMQPGDTEITFADVSELEKDFGFRPTTSLREGLRKFAEWYREFYGK